MTHPAIQHIDWTINNLPLLEQTIHKGTPRHWNERRPTPEKASQLASTLRRTPDPSRPPLAPSPAPLHLDVLDLLITIRKNVVNLLTWLYPGTKRTIACSTADYLRLIRAALLPHPDLCDQALDVVLYISAALEAPSATSPPHCTSKPHAPTASKRSSPS